MSTKYLESIALCNSEGFGRVDYYSKAENIAEFLNDYGIENAGVIHTKVKGKIAGFVLWHIENEAINICRRAVYEKYQGLGLGIKLTRQTMAIGQSFGVHFETYASTWNIASINSSIKCGCYITHIGKDWVHLTNKKRVKKV